MYNLTIPGGYLEGPVNNFNRPSHFRNYKILADHNVNSKIKAVPFQEILANEQEVIKIPTTGSPDSTKVYNYKDIEASYSLQCKKNNSPIFEASSNTVPTIKQNKDNKWYYIVGFIIIIVFFLYRGK